MILIKEIVNSVFTSKTYIIYTENERTSWLVDIGDILPVIAFASEHNKSIGGVFLTHGHFDHIYGLQSLIELFPSCIIFTTEYGKECLKSDKLNLSRYHSSPFSI